jgi:hypothetical protein
MKQRNCSILSLNKTPTKFLSRAGKSAVIHKLNVSGTHVDMNIFLLFWYMELRYEEDGKDTAHRE